MDSHPTNCRQVLCRCSPSLRSVVEPAFYNRGCSFIVYVMGNKKSPCGGSYMAEREGLLAFARPSGQRRIRAAVLPRYAQSSNLLFIIEGARSPSMSWAIKNHPAVVHIWRRERDSNPRWSYKPHTPLAGERLQPLGHLSI